MGNNGIWALEKHPMEFLYGYSVAADLQPGCRYDEVVEALGGHGELVERPGRAAAGARARLRLRQARAGERAHRPGGRLPAQVEPGLSRSRSPRPRNGTARIIAGGSKSAPSGRAGVRALKGPVRSRTAGGADTMRLRPNLCTGRGPTAFMPHGFSTQRDATIERRYRSAAGIGGSDGLRFICAGLQRPRALASYRPASSSAAPWRMSASQTSISSRPKARIDLDQDHDAGDDRRRAVGVEAGDLAGAPRAAARRAGEHALAASAAASRWPCTRSGS